MKMRKPGSLQKKATIIIGASLLALLLVFLLNWLERTQMRSSKGIIDAIIQEEASRIKKEALKSRIDDNK